LIQGIIYWTTGFSIFNKISEILFKEVNCKWILQKQLKMQVYNK
jgi:hypothetical protein